jgi:epoxyqueuosine reductase
VQRLHRYLPDAGDRRCVPARCAALHLRALIGNRIYGCDDCQLVCPWNKYAHKSTLKDFDRRAAFDDPDLLTLWSWSEAEFLRHTEGSAIRRIGHERWQRNIAVALGNAWRAGGDERHARALTAQRSAATPLVAEHIDWALAQRPQPSGTIVPAQGAPRATE